MDAFTPFDQRNTSFTSPITDFNMNDWITDADDWNTFYNFNALPVGQPSGFTNQGVEDGFRSSHRNTIIDRFATRGLGPTIDPTRLEYVPFGIADPYRTDLFDSDKTETSELGQGSFNRTWADSTVPYNNDGKNSMLSVTTTSVARTSSMECPCITCVDLGSRREVMWNVDSYCYRCRLSDCNFSAVAEDYRRSGYAPEYAAEKAARKHEKDHFRHEGQLRCIENRCVYRAKRWPDLKRHYTSKHCLNPKTKFPCPEIGCKYSGDNGFTRKDKLKSHRDKVHGKPANTGKRSRVSKSNAQGAA